MISEIFRFLKELKAEDIPVIAGGIIPVEDIKELKKIGVKDGFLPEESLSNIIDYVTKITETNNISNNNR